MARVYLRDVVIIGNEEEWVSTKYEIYTDETMETLLYETEKTENLMDVLIVTLKYPDSDVLYPPELGTYARIRVFLSNGRWSRWYTAVCE